MTIRFTKGCGMKSALEVDMDRYYILQIAQLVMLTAIYVTLWVKR